MSRERPKLAGNAAPRGSSGARRPEGACFEEPKISECGCYVLSSCQGAAVLGPLMLRIELSIAVPD